MVIPFVYFDHLMELRNPGAVWVPETFRDGSEADPGRSSLLAAKVRPTAATAKAETPSLLAANQDRWPRKVHHC